MDSFVDLTISSLSWRCGLFHRNCYYIICGYYHRTCSHHLSHWAFHLCNQTFDETCRPGQCWQEEDCFHLQLLWGVHLVTNAKHFTRMQPPRLIGGLLFGEEESGWIVMMTRLEMRMCKLHRELHIPPLSLEFHCWEVMSANIGAVLEMPMFATGVLVFLHVVAAIILAFDLQWLQLVPQFLFTSIHHPRGWAATLWPSLSMVPQWQLPSCFSSSQSLSPTLSVVKVLAIEAVSIFFFGFLSGRWTDWLVKGKELISATPCIQIFVIWPLFDPACVCTKVMQSGK